ncbi:lysine-specific demethylase 8-like [Planoprotostelium fungivorum]|uniref:Lysine-specific demethylase 8-like n=1 Tax=Planoprotostelium fungivorum TaxID=1890364 RepID=A0A2P6NXK7_9EUKA|nr:lysine-specific demethylase 8-like [Planoprotostelium fungivorum]
MTPPPEETSASWNLSARTSCSQDQSEKLPIYTHDSSHDGQVTEMGGAIWIELCSNTTRDLRKFLKEKNVKKSNAEATVTQLEGQCSELLEACWEALHGGVWKDVPVVWRKLYSYVCLLFASCKGLQQPTPEMKGEKEALKQLDLGLIMGTPNETIRSLISRFASELTKQLPQDEKKEEKKEEKKDDTTGGTKRKAEDEGEGEAAKSAKNIDPKRAVEVASRLPMEEFMISYYLLSKPVIITDCMEHWPAMNERKWSDLNYLKRIAGPRTVPIEVGRHYLDDDWGQKLMSLSEFIEEYVKNPRAGQPRGYLAQTPLFDQLPDLRKDICVPEYCALADDDFSGDENEEDVAINGWLGPCGTISPAHYDPKNNLLCQVVGSKYVRMYAPSQTDKLYPLAGKMKNSSGVDVEDPDEEKFPKFRDAQYVECVLKEGEMLFIPKKWWHYVRSLSVSFSVSFWKAKNKGIQPEPPSFSYILEGWEDGVKFSREVDSLDRWATQSAIQVTDPHSPHLGGYLWDSSSLFCCYLESATACGALDLRDKTCIELGSGVGLVGVMLAKLKTHRVIMTDIQELADVMRENLNINRGEESKSALVTERDVLYAAPLFWGDKEAADHIIETYVRPQEYPDYLFAVDCIYSEASASGLVVSMDHLCGPDTIIYCISEQRNEEAQRKFKEEAEKIFDLKVTPREEWFPFDVNLSAETARRHTACANSGKNVTRYAVKKYPFEATDVILKTQLLDKFVSQFAEQNNLLPTGVMKEACIIFPLEQNNTPGYRLLTCTASSSLKKYSSITQTHGFTFRKRLELQDGRRRGNVTTVEQHAMLEQAYKKKERPTAPEFVTLSEKIMMPERRIRNWFQNKRSKESRQMKQNRLMCGSLCVDTKGENTEEEHNLNKMNISYITDTDQEIIV